MAEDKATADKEEVEIQTHLKITCILNSMRFGEELTRQTEAFLFLCLYSDV